MCVRKVDAECCPIYCLLDPFLSFFVIFFFAKSRWHDDKAHGWGMKAFANGDRHEGEYCLDLRQGCGTYHWANGDCYEGDWEVCYLMATPVMKNVKYVVVFSLDQNLNV